MARAVPLLRPSDVRTINAGAAVPGGAIGVIAPGTGLGEAFLTWDDSRYVAHSSEGGHADFAPTNGREIQLLEYMLKKLEHVSVEHVCSGIGIPHIYGYLRDVERIEERLEVAALIAAAADPSVAIIQHAFGSENRSKLCESTIDMFVSILASEAANLAVKVLATGGVYIAGGVVTHMLAALQRPAFMQSFKRKGRLSELMAHIPIAGYRHFARIDRRRCSRARKLKRIPNSDRVVNPLEFMLLEFGSSQFVHNAQKRGLLVP